MNDQLDSSLVEDPNSQSPRGRGLGIAAMIIGLVALIWSIFPYLGATAWVLGVIGFILSVVAFFIAKAGNNPRKGTILSAIILNGIAIMISIYWIYKITMAVNSLTEQMNDAFKNIDTTAIQNNKLDSVNNKQNTY